MHGDTRSHFHCRQIHAAGLLAFGEDKLSYFPRDFGVDRFSRFLSSGASASSTGAGVADLFIDLDKGALQLPITAERLDLALGLALLSRCGEALVTVLPLTL